MRLAAFALVVFIFGTTAHADDLTPIIESIEELVAEGAAKDLAADVRGGSNEKSPLAPELKAKLKAATGNCERLLKSGELDHALINDAADTAHLVYTPPRPYLFFGAPKHYSLRWESYGHFFYIQSDYTDWWAPLIELCGLVAIAAVIVLAIRTYNRRADDHVQRTQQQIQKDESEGMALVASLEARQAVEQHQPEAPPEDAAKREELEKRLASLQDAQKTALPAAVADDLPPDAISKSLAKLRENIADVQRQLAELSDTESTSETDQTSATPPLSRRALYDEAIARLPNNASLYSDRAWYLRNVDRDKALADAERALQLIPDYPFALNARGVIRNAKGDVRGAIKDYCRAIDLNPKMLAPSSNLAAIYNKQGKHKEAIVVAADAIEIDSSFAPAHAQLGKAHAGLGNREEAIHHYTLAFDADPERYAYMLHDRAKLHHQIGNDERALHDLKTLVARDKANQSTFDLLITLEPREPEHHQQREKQRDYNDKQGKADDLRRAIALYRDRKPCREFVECVTEMIQAQFWLDDANCEETIDLGREAAKMATELGEMELAADALTYTRNFARKSGEHDHAISLSLELIRIDSKLFFRYSELLIEILHESGRTDRAVETAFKAIEEHGDDERAFLIGVALFKVIRQTKEHDEEHAIALITEIENRLADDWSTNLQGSAICTLSHSYLAGCHVQWHDTPFYDLAKAQYHAQQAWELGDDKQSHAALLWAIYELIEEGSAADQLEESYPDPIVYREIEQEGRKKLQALQPSEA